MEIERNYKRKSKIDLTPLIDIIFLLVVFFLLTTKFVTSEIIDLNISTISNDIKNSDSNALVIILSDNNKFLLADKEYNLDHLKKIISPILSTDKNKNIIIMNNEGVTIQNIVTAMDQIKASGGYNISIGKSL
jgi:biopolymer transport protein ExbD